MKDLSAVIEQYKKKNIQLIGLVSIKSGKEAAVYKVSLDNKLYALKVYKDITERAFKNDSAYNEGKFYRNPSIRKAITKRTSFGKKFTQTSWVRREFHFLQKLQGFGANIPKVINFTDNSILMELIGDEHTLGARLVDVRLSHEQQMSLFPILMKNVELFLKVGIVHGDLSPYNILFWKDNPYIIDFPQAIDIRNNPNTQAFLHRDIDTILKYFGDLNINKEEIYRKFRLYYHL